MLFGGFPEPFLLNELEGFDWFWILKSTAVIDFGKLGSKLDFAILLLLLICPKKAFAKPSIIIKINKKIVVNNIIAPIIMQGSV